MLCCIKYVPIILYENSHSAGLASLHRDEVGILVAVIHLKKYVYNR
jgi:hypothetical protein